MHSIDKIVIIKGSSQYDVMRLVCDEFGLAFKNLGCSVSIMDIGLYSYSDSDIASLSHFDMIFSIDAIGLELYNRLEFKPFFWSFLVDPPFYLNERLKQIDGNVMISCVDRNHVNYIDKYYKNIPWTCFMPHGGIIGNIYPMVPYDERIYNIVMLGSLGKLDSINNVIDSIKADYEPIAAVLIDKCLSDFDINLDDALNEMINEYRMDFSDNMFREFMYILRPIDALRRRYKRSNLIRSLLSHGISMHLWGDGWEDIKKFDPDNLLNIHECVEYKEANNIMRNSRIVLNDMPLFHDGSHERVFAAMQSGAIVATDKSIFLEECFSDKEDILFYNELNINDLAESVTILLNDSEKACSIIKNSFELSMYHKWSDRASAILEIASELIP